MAKAQYDKIAEEYADSQEVSINRAYTHEPTFFEVLGDVEGKSVLDLACGNGILTRKIKTKGAKKVVGVDESASLIKLAERISPDGIKYIVRKVGEMGQIDAFDIVTAGYLFHYAKTKEELQKMFNDAYKNLKKNGRLVAINNDPESPLTNNWKYGTVTEVKGELKEGATLVVSLYEGDRPACTFTQKFWLKKTYEIAAKKAGFKDFVWHKLGISPEGIKKFGEEFWKEFKKDPAIVVFEARK